MTEAKALCPSGKKRHATLKHAGTAAHAYARHLNREGKIAEDLYAYRCDRCRGGWHITRKRSWSPDPRERRPDRELVYTAPPEALQRWAMGTAGDE